MPATRMQKRVALNNILFATDFSPAADSALPYAAGFARSFGANLFAIHVQEPANYALPPESWRYVQMAEETNLQELGKTIRREFPDINPQMLLAEGKVCAAVESAVKEHQVDLVVVGTRGRTGLGKTLLGSQAEEILRYATCPVLTVGPRAQGKQERMRGKIASILFATDFGPASYAAAPLAISLAEENQARLTLLHVTEHHEIKEAANWPDYGEWCERRLRDLVPDEAHLWCAPHFVVERGQAAERILETARRADADLIVLGVHGPEGVPGAATHLPIATVHSVVTLAECPVMTVSTRSLCNGCAC